MSSVEQQRLKKWIDVLQDNDSEMSRIAAQKLADIGSKEAVPHLIKAMETRTMFVAAAAAQALGKIGDSQSGGFALRRDAVSPSRCGCPTSGGRSPWRNWTRLCCQSS